MLLVVELLDEHEQDVADVVVELAPQVFEHGNKYAENLNASFDVEATPSVPVAIQAPLNEKEKLQQAYFALILDDFNDSFGISRNVILQRHRHLREISKIDVSFFFITSRVIA